MRRENALVPRLARDGPRERTDRGHGALLRGRGRSRRFYDTDILQAIITERKRAV